MRDLEEKERLLVVGGRGAEVEPARHDFVGQYERLRAGREKKGVRCLQRATLGGHHTTDTAPSWLLLASDAEEPGGEGLGAREVVVQDQRGRRVVGRALVQHVLQGARCRCLQRQGSNQPC